MKHLIDPFKRKHDPATCEAAFALVAAVLQDRSITGTKEEIEATLDRAAQDFASAASDAIRRQKK